jgi:hypothetical protein
MLAQSALLVLLAIQPAAAAWITNLQSRSSSIHGAGTQHSGNEAWDACVGAGGNPIFLYVKGTITDGSIGGIPVLGCSLTDKGVPATFPCPGSYPYPISNATESSTYGSADGLNYCISSKSGSALTDIVCQDPSALSLGCPCTSSCAQGVCYPARNYPNTGVTEKFCLATQPTLAIICPSGLT